MKKSGWSCLVIGFLLTTSVACKPLTEDDNRPEPTANMTATSAVAQQPTATSSFDPEATDTLAPQPSVSPTSFIPADWQRIGGSLTGLQLSVPPGWVNLSGRLDAAAATDLLGLIALFVSDSERTGASVLAGKEMNTGAYALGLVTNLDLPASVPLTSLERLLGQLGATVTPVSSITPVTTAAGNQGAYVDVTGDPARLFSTGGQALRTRILLFTPETSSGVAVPNKQAIFLLSAPIAAWNSYEETFVLMTRTIVVHNIQDNVVIGGGTAHLVGDLNGRQIVNGDLNRGAKDIWTFSIAEARYATLTLEPVDNQLDLALTLINPSRQIVARVDNGYTGATEKLADVLLLESGLYVVEVSEFFNEPGRYNLQVDLADQPLFSGQGRMVIGESIQGVLPPNGQQIWMFGGVAGQKVSIVLAPTSDQFDAILDLYGPDGTRLVALDEGFSGDPEVISGFELPVTGDYAILVRSFAGDSEAYTLSLDEGEEATSNFHDAGDLIYGDTKQEVLQPREAHAWFFTGNAGDEVAVKVVPLDEALDLDIWLLDPDITRIAAKDKFAAGMAETIEMKLPVDGQYVILVRDFFGMAGGYEVGLIAMPLALPDYAGALNLGEPAGGTLLPGQVAFWFFDGRQGVTLDISLIPANETHDLVFTLQDPEGRTVLEVDGSLTGIEELTDFVLTADGQWRILVREFFGEPATYELIVSPN